MGDSDHSDGRGFVENLCSRFFRLSEINLAGDHADAERRAL